MAHVIAGLVPVRQGGLRRPYRAKLDEPGLHPPGQVGGLGVGPGQQQYGLAAQVIREPHRCGAVVGGFLVGAPDAAVPVVGGDRGQVAVAEADAGLPLPLRIEPADFVQFRGGDLAGEQPEHSPGNRWLPRIELAVGLEGGGSVVFLEFVAPVDHPAAGQFAGQWRARAGDAEFGEVRRAAQMIDAEYRESTPWWGRCDLDDAHIFRAAGGRPVLIDVFCMAGTELYRAILEDVAGVHRRIPRERMRHALDIPYIARENSTAEILALRKAWARAAG